MILGHGRQSGGCDVACMQCQSHLFAITIALALLYSRVSKTSATPQQLAVLTDTASISTKFGPGQLDENSESAATVRWMASTAYG
jgi:hypothetical protein